MADVTVSRPIAASPERVWSLISDVSRMGEWSPETEEGVWVKGATGPELGARFKGKNDIDGRRWTTDCEVVDCEPGRSFSFRVKAGPLSVALWEYEIEPDGSGCVVEERWTRESGWFVKTVGKLTTKVDHDAEWSRMGMQATLDRLASVAEAG